jgi:hypothetical protein
MSANLFASLEPKSKKIEAFLNEIEDKLAEGKLSPEDAKVYLDDLIERHDLPLTEHEYQVWSTKLVGKLFNSGLSGASSIHAVDYPTLLNPEHLDDNGLWPKVRDAIPKGGFKKGEMVILGGGNVGQQHMRGLNHVDEIPFIVSSEIEPNHTHRHGNDFIIRNYDAEIPELQAFDSKDRNRVVHSERKVLTPNQRNKRNAKNKSASIARRKSRK